LYAVRCKNVKAYFERGADADQRCRDVILTQDVPSLEKFQVPEPWCGDLESAPILFVSSNPSIDKDSAAFWTGDDGAPKGSRRGRQAGRESLQTS
jgi:hypothetical protein